MMNYRSISAYNTNLDLDNSPCHAQPYPIMTVKFSLIPTPPPLCCMQAVPCPSLSRPWFGTDVHGSISYNSHKRPVRLHHLRLKLSVGKLEKINHRIRPANGNVDQYLLGKLHVRLDNLLTNWITDWLIDLQSYWATDWATDWLTDRLTDRITVCLTDWLTDWLTGGLIDWLSDWLSDCLTDWLTGWLTG